MHQESPPGNDSNRPLTLMSICCQPCVMDSLIFMKWHGFCRASICRFGFSWTRNISGAYPIHCRVLSNSQGGAHGIPGEGSTRLHDVQLLASRAAVVRYSVALSSMQGASRVPHKAKHSTGRALCRSETCPSHCLASVVLPLPPKAPLWGAGAIRNRLRVPQRRAAANHTATDSVLCPTVSDHGPPIRLRLCQRCTGGSVSRPLIGVCSVLCAAAACPRTVRP